MPCFDSLIPFLAVLDFLIWLLSPPFCAKLGKEWLKYVPKLMPYLLKCLADPEVCNFRFLTPLRLVALEVLF